MTPDLAIAWLLFNIFLVTITLVWGIFWFRRGIWYRKLTLQIQAYLLWGIGGLALLSSIYPFAYLYTEHLWYFENVGYADVFWKILKVRWGIFAGFFFVALAFMNLNAMIAKRLCPEPREFSRWTHRRTVSFHRSFFVGTILLAILFAIPMMSLHDEYLRYTDQPVGPELVLANAEENQSPTPETLFFGKDTNFYLFSLPLHKAVSLWVWILVWTTSCVVGLLYNFYYRRDARSMGFVKRNIVFHGSFLWLMLLATGIWLSYVNLWGKVYTKSATPSLNRMHGLFYMDAQLAGSTFIYAAILLGIAALIIINLFWRKRILWYAAIVVWCVGYVSLIQVYPRVVHYVNVQNDYLIPEKKHLQTHIESTREAFDLNKIIQKDYEAGPATLELVNNEENRKVLENIQLWDRRVLYDILRAEHNVRHHNYHPYTDIDRYEITEVSEENEEGSGVESEKQYRQVLIAAREIQPDPQVQGVRGNWRNRKLAFTHGYGVYVVPANAVDEKKSPIFWTEVKLNPQKLKNEAVALYPELNITQPRIYYGEMTNDYVIANTTVGEYDFESEVTLTSSNGDRGDTTTATDEDDNYHYDGPGGVMLTGWFRRLCFTIRFLDLQILYNKNKVLHPESRIMFWRGIGTRRGKQVITDRISHIAPFLEYDPDPYIVIADGQLWWIVDFYITSKWYPNAQFYKDDTSEVPANFQDAEVQYKKFNYIRNSGVAIVNAYTGKVNFYAVKENEAIMNTYQKTFPNLFKGFDEMPSGLHAHLRFPDYLTRIQANVYKDYHVTDAEDFLLKGLQLMMPQEVYGAGKTINNSPKWKDDQEMMPYYAMIRLPGEDNLEFVNMIPFTPYKKEFDMKAWLVVRCDSPHYGERIVYTFKNTPEVKGPKHVEDLITSRLSEEFLKMQASNVVIRGNLYFIPLEQGIIYVEAIYQKPDTAEDTEKKEDERPKRPTLANIVTAANDNLAYDPIFSESVRKAVEVGLKVNGSDTNGTLGMADEEKEPTFEERFENLMKALEELRKAYQSIEAKDGQSTPAKAGGNAKAGGKKKKDNK